MQVRHDREGKDEGDRLGESWVEEVLDEGLADGSEGNRERRDPELHRSDEAHRVVHDAKCHASPAVAVVGKLHQPRSPGRHERVFGSDEERVPCDEQENGHDLEKIAHAPLPGAWVLGGISSNFQSSE